MNIFEGRKTYRCPHCGDDSVFPGYKTCSSCGGAVSGKAQEVEPEGCLTSILCLVFIILLIAFVVIMINIIGSAKESVSSVILLFLDSALG